MNSGYEHGVESTWPWSKESVETYTIARDYPNLFKQPDDTRRAWAWWAWKPIIIAHHLQQMLDGETCIYADAGVEFINNVSHIIDRMDQDIFLFGNNWEHAHWCKRDVVDELWPGARWPPGWATYLHAGITEQQLAWLSFGKQCQASVIFFRVSDYSKQFVAEWLNWCLFEGGRLIDDSPSRAPNHPEFRENRHDQSILTTMAYREGIKLHAWPAVYNRFLGQEFVYSREGYPESDNYPSVFHHHRLRDSEFQALKVAV
jgi:hypothetical protein